MIKMNFIFSAIVNNFIGDVSIPKLIFIVR